MKYWLTLAALIGLSSASWAAQETYDVECDTLTTVSVTVSSYTTTGGTYKLFTASLVGSTTVFPLVMPNRKSLEIQNVDASSPTFCTFDTIKSTTPANWLTHTLGTALSASVGHYIPAGGSWKLNAPVYQPTNGYPLIPVCVSGATGNVVGHANVLQITQCGSY